MNRAAVVGVAFFFVVVVASAASTVGCTSLEDGAPASAQADFTTQGGILGQAPKLELGKTKHGTIRGGQLDVWALDVREGDKLTIVESVTQGSLEPDFALFAGGSAHVRSTSHEALKKKLTKNYVATSGGKHFIGVAAFEGRGEGNYSIKVTCTGGPCAGQPFVRPLEDEQKNTCIQKTRQCALVKARPATVGSKVTIASVRAAWDACLKESSLPTGESCALACDEGDALATCKGITQAIKFYAAKPPACTATLNDCMSSCIDAGDDSPISEQICMLDGFNNTCDGFARSNKSCGGAEEPGSNEECHSLCRATFGAWNDDLDTICEEQCPE